MVCNGRLFLSMFVCCFVNLSVCCRMFLVIEVEILLMLNEIKLQLLLSVMLLLNHFKTVLVLCNWLNCNLSIISEIIVYTSCLLTFPSSFFGGFIKHVRLERKLCLWSLSVSSCSCNAFDSIARGLVGIPYAFKLLEASSLGGILLFKPTEMQ